MKPLYRASIVGLTGIAAGKPGAGQPGMGTPMPHSHASAYAYVPFTEVVAVCDLIPERVENFKQTWADVWPDVRGFTDYEAMLDEISPDILSVVTSDNRHADIVVKAAESGVKAILCEKPIATSLADADRMIAAMENHGVAASINHTRRWRPIYRQVKAEIEKGTIGELK